MAVVKVKRNGVWETIGAGSSGVSSNSNSGLVKIGEVILNNNNTTISSLETGGGFVDFNETLKEEISTIFDKCKENQLPITLVFAADDLSFAYNCTYISGSENLQVYENIQLISIEQIQSSSLSLYIMTREQIETNENRLMQLLSNGFDIKISFYINSKISGNTSEYPFIEGVEF